jgi:predicted MFS family arabinose efflux permease
VVADPSDLPSALSLTTATASLAQLLGPALSGIVLNAFGAAVCFFINAASFGAVIVSLLLMKLPVHERKKSEKKVIAEFIEGFSYLKRTPDIGLVILMLAFVSLLVLPYNTVLPVFAKVIFKGNAATFGYITSFIGIGAVMGTIFLASRKPGAHLRRILLVSTIIMGVGLICFSQIKIFPIAMFFAVLTGLGSIVQFTVCNIIVQSESAPQMRGRIISILLMAIFGMMPLGSLLVGAVSKHVGAPVTVLCQGIAALVIAMLFSGFLRKDRPGQSLSF